MKPLVENIHKKLSPDKFVSCTLAVDNLWIQKKLCRAFPPGYPPIHSLFIFKKAFLLILWITCETLVLELFLLHSFLWTS